VEVGAPGTGTDHLQPIDTTMVEQAVPLQPMVYHSRANIHGPAHSGIGRYGLKEVAAHGQSMQAETLGQNCSLCRQANAVVGCLAGDAACEGPMLEYVQS